MLQTIKRQYTLEVDFETHRLASHSTHDDKTALSDISKNVKKGKPQ